MKTILILLVGMVSLSACSQKAAASSTLILGAVPTGFFVGWWIAKIRHKILTWIYGK